MTLRAAVVGTGFGYVTHVRALRAAGFDVVALVGRDAERTGQRAKQFGVAGAATSLSDVLHGVDAVTIATPPHTHAPLALEAIAAGKHLICEKPFARDADGPARCWPPRSRRASSTSSARSSGGTPAKPPSRAP